MDSGTLPVLQERPYWMEKFCQTQFEPQQVFSEGRESSGEYEANFSFKKHVYLFTKIVLTSYHLERLYYFLFPFSFRI